MKKIKFNISLFTLILAGLIILSTNENFGISGGNDWKVPEFVKKLKNPLPKNKLSLEMGKKLYTQNCETCHGETGVGDGPGGKYLGKKVGDLTTNDFQSQADGVIFYKITRGRAPMPAFSTILKTEQRWAVINYIKSLKSN